VLPPANRAPGILRSNGRPEDCLGCPLDTGDNRARTQGISFMNPEGTGALGVMIMAEALGSHEAKDKLPLRPNAPAGSVFQGIIRRFAGIDRNQFLISNAIWCQPGVKNWLDGAPYEYGAIEHCRVHNGRLVRERRPKVIVTMGAIPTRTLTGLSGDKLGIKLVRGFYIPAHGSAYSHPDGTPITVIPTYHPSFLLRASKTRSKDKDSGGTGGKVEKAEGGMALAGVVARDILQAVALAKNGGKFVRRVPTAIRCTEEVARYQLLERIRNHPELPIGWDIETPRSTDKADDESEIDSLQANVTQIQFALDDQTGYVFPGFNEASWVKPLTREILGTRNTKYSWNGWKFDNKIVCGFHGIPLNGIDIDLMTAWHWIQPDLPQGLQFATSFYVPELGPWKHLVYEDADFYGANDVISLILNATGIFRAMEEKGLRRSYDRHIIQLHGELTLASKRGFPVDLAAQKQFGREVDAEMETLEEITDKLVPVGKGAASEIRKLEPRRGRRESGDVGYIKTPKQILPFLDESTGLPLDGSDRVVLREEVDVEDEDGNPTGEKSIKLVSYVQRAVQVLNKQTLEIETILRWCRMQPFNPDARDQIFAYIKTKRAEEIQKRLARGQSRTDAERLTKHKIPRVQNKHKEWKDNAGAKELERLAKDTGDPVYKNTVDIKKLRKIKGTYINGWDARDGSVHTTFSSLPATGQLSSVDPNIQNAPKHGDLAKKFRKIIKAKPGHVLIEFDKKSFHAQTLAFEAEDPNYLRLAKIDIHSYVAAHMVKHPERGNLLSFSDKDLKAALGALKKEKFLYTDYKDTSHPDGMTFKQIRDEKAKRTILGIGFCQGANSLLQQNPESFRNRAEIEAILKLLRELFSPVFSFQKAIQQIAHRQTYLISRYRYIRRFYDVLKWNPNAYNATDGTLGGWENGDDAEAAVAFLPANDAFGMIKEEILRLGEMGANEEFGFCNQIHDALMFHCPIELKNKCIDVVTTEMLRPSPVLVNPVALEGLRVEVGCLIGEDWASMEELPEEYYLPYMEAATMPMAA
jgi:uracil-DNA glycosylase family 4